MRLVTLAFLALISAMAVTGCQQQPAPIAVDAAKGTVTIEIVSADGTKTYTVDDVSDGSTLEQVMRSAKDFPAEISGSGTTAFVSSIDGLSTSASEGWTYKIDDEFIHEGVGVTTLSPPTTVTWKFTGWDSE
ncbi:DUF4430 domain-containing protein [Rubripirellula reticaptiva]|uniref:Transcobalamin-like C-terminal domain-containing protein n=1 Tax=Rubripirellula reticaptiva TaxID=2528013 RepID=A0A5C6EHV8_9BACT|nr:DUF4430 domain-containing protein [Rubripirellula reticaptiva]TWU48055.1 hypothetical protein Poly59_49000 [Rubripirellula reticaptiva]